MHLSRILTPFFIIGHLSTAGATVLLFNFGGGSPTQGGSWNTIEGLGTTGGATQHDQGGSIAAGSVVDANGNVMAGVSFLGEGFTRHGSFDSADNGTGWAHAGTTFADTEAAQHSWWVGLDNPGSGTLTISGLDDVFTYDVELLAVRSTGDSTNRRGEYSITGGGSTVSGFNAKIDGWDNGNVMSWSGITTDGSGNFTVSATDNPDNAYVSALKVTVIPEPSSLALVLLVLGAGGLSRYFRRRL